MTEYRGQKERVKGPADEAALPPYLRAVGTDSVSLSLKVVPRSSRSGPLEQAGTELRWGVQAAPVDGAANAALCKDIADFFSLPKRAVTITTGARSRRKVVAIEGIAAKDAAKRLADG